MVKRCFIRGDEAVLQKERVVEAFELMLPAHLIFAQRLFGTAGGISTRSSQSCRLKQKHLSMWAEDHHQIRFYDELNVVPFEHYTGSNEVTRRGIIIQYIPSEQELTVIICFR
jgi:hypothetical protein